MNIFTLESRSDLQKIDSNWENFVAEICNIRQFPMANCLGYGMKMVPKMPGMSFSLFVVNYQVYPHPNLARIWSGTTKTGRTLLHRSLSDLRSCRIIQIFSTILKILWKSSKTISSDVLKHPLPRYASTTAQSRYSPNVAAIEGFWRPPIHSFSSDALRI